ncbi:MAG: hypothetical protein RL528_565 [Bacteroidota bacterium]
MKLLLFSVLFPFLLISQEFELIQYSKDPIHSRALTIYNEQLFIGTNNGQLFVYPLNDSSIAKPYFLNRLFPEIRDIHCDKNGIILMQTGDFASLIKIESNGVLKQEPYYTSFDSNKTLFLDGMDFENNLGFLMGDPFEGFFSLFYSEDNGLSWKSCLTKIPAIDGEAAFAASGTTVKISNGEFIFVSGGKQARFFRSSDKGISWTISPLPFPSSESSGPYSLAMIDGKNGIVVGGDYTQPNEKQNTSFYTKNGGKTWKKPKQEANGYRSCVYYYRGITYCCGTNGIDYSNDNGKTWNKLATNNCFAIVAHDDFIYFSSVNGSILKMKAIKQ